MDFGILIEFGGLILDSAYSSLGFVYLSVLELVLWWFVVICRFSTLRFSVWGLYKTECFEIWGNFGNFWVEFILLF